MINKIIYTCIILFSSISLYGTTSSNTKLCESHPAMAELKSTTNGILEQLNAQKGQIKQDSKLVYGVINNSLVKKADFNAMSRLVLTSNWRKLNTKQKQDFTKEFSRLIIRTYGVAFESYNGETVTYNCPIRELPSSSNYQRVELSTTIHSASRPNINVKFRMVQKGNDNNGAWLVYDFIIDNVSIINSYRHVFSDKLRSTSNADNVIADMRQKNCKIKMFCD